MGKWSLHGLALTELLMIPSLSNRDNNRGKGKLYKPNTEQEKERLFLFLASEKVAL